MNKNYVAPLRGAITVALALLASIPGKASAQALSTDHSFKAQDGSDRGGDLRIPARARALIGKNAVFNGPNCWNAALYAIGLVDGIRHVTGTEFNSVVTKNCKEIEAIERLPGDIVAFRRVSKNGKLVRGPYGFELHAFYLVSKNHAFTKNGSLALNEYRIQDLESLTAEYQQSNRQECRVLGFPREMCQMKTQVLRCEPSSLVATPSTTELAEATSALEHELNDLYLNGSSEPDLEKLRTSLKQRIDALAQDSARFRANGSASEALDLIDLRLESFRTFMF